MNLVERPQPSLILVATPIGNLGDISQRALEVLSAADSVACEDSRRTGSLFAHFGIPHTPFIVCNDHTERAATEEILSRVAAGQTVALVSDAGTPAVSDPGQRVVEAAIERGIAVQSIPGASAVLVGLTLSGLGTDRFCFDGFLPRKGGDRTLRIGALIGEQRTVVLYEAPHRLARTMSDLAEQLGGSRQVVLARELTKRYEEIWRGTMAEAVKHTIDVEPRGEYVVIIEGAAEIEVTEESLMEALRVEMASGASRRDAVAAVVHMTGAKKRQVYDLALQLD
ncbi:MAG: 16S rRNA (cytidine1402-2'-O)-methyltransferase [Verrucomicrobiales bacterium]|jgi:16S rRNA (cytidine1402-2'-O)-methyltransferase